MPNLAINKCSSIDDRIKNESGERAYPIWLIVNPKDFGVRLNIWIPLLEEIQDKLYRTLHIRMDTKNIFIKNVVKDTGTIPDSIDFGSPEVAQEIKMLRVSVQEYQPKIIFTFGSLAFEFVRHVLENKVEKGAKYWSTTELEDEFERAIANFDIHQTNKIPLLSRVKKSSKFFEDEDLNQNEGDNYLKNAAEKIANRLMENKDSFEIWLTKKPE